MQLFLNVEEVFELRDVCELFLFKIKLQIMLY